MEETIVNRRSVNYTPREEGLLVRIIDKYKKTVECKEGGAVMWKKKEDAWRKIADEFNNSSYDTYRCVKSLQEKYFNLKKRARRKLMLNRTKRVTHKEVRLSDAELAVTNIIEQVERLSNTYEDSTNVESLIKDPICMTDREPLHKEILLVECFNNLEEHNYEIDSSLKTYSNQKLRCLGKELQIMEKKKNTRLPGDNHDEEKESVSNKSMDLTEELLTEKINFVKLQKAKFLEEHGIKMKLLKTMLENEEMKKKEFS